jgi:hypothetical protein
MRRSQGEVDGWPCEAEGSPQPTRRWPHGANHPPRRVRLSPREVDGSPHGVDGSPEEADGSRRKLDGSSQRVGGSHRGTSVSPRIRNRPRRGAERSPRRANRPELYAGHPPVCLVRAPNKTHRRHPDARNERKDLGGRTFPPAQILPARGARPQDGFSGELRGFDRRSTAHTAAPGSCHLQGRSHNAVRPPGAAAP